MRSSLLAATRESLCKKKKQQRSSAAKNKWSWPWHKLIYFAESHSPRPLAFYLQHHSCEKHTALSRLVSKIIKSKSKAQHDMWTGEKHLKPLASFFCQIIWNFIFQTLLLFDLQATIMPRLACVWFLSGKLHGIPCFHCLSFSACVCCVLVTAAAAAAESLQSWPTLCDPIDGSPPGSPVPGIL